MGVGVKLAAAALTAAEIFADVPLPKPGQELEALASFSHDDDNAPVAVALVPIGLTGTVQFNVPTATDTPEVAKARADAINKALGYGKIKLETDFTGYLVFVDGISYGKDTKKIERMNAGSHSVIVQLEGFEDFSTKVDVKERDTHTIEVTKAKLTPMSVR